MLRDPVLSSPREGADPEPAGASARSGADSAPGAPGPLARAETTPPQGRSPPLSVGPPPKLPRSAPLDPGRARLQRDLAAWLDALGLRVRLPDAVRWCDWVGAAFLEEVAENVEDLIEFLELPEEEARRVAEKSREAVLKAASDASSALADAGTGAGARAVPPRECLPPPAPPPAPEPACYALGDAEYGQWKRARAACRKDPGSLEPLRGVACSRRVLNWRDPVSGQTLLHELAARGAPEAVIGEAARLGCEPLLRNAEGQTALQLCRRGQATAWGKRAARMEARPVEGWAQTAPAALSRRVTTSALASPPWQLPGKDRLGEPSAAAALALAPVQRKKGRSLAVNETATMPKARMSLELDVVSPEALDVRALQRAVTTTYGGSASVQVDRVCDKAATMGMSERTQTVSCRVMFDDADEARRWRESGRVVQDNVAQNMGLTQGTVVLDAPATVEDVDSITLKLDSDSTHILCGACLLYNSDGACEKVVHFSDRRFGDDAVRHSGDTKVDGKSVHTISIVQSKVPVSVSQMYFTLCSCGPANLSGFKNPSIMLYDQAQPDANLLEYRIDQAADSTSCVIARLVRKPSWNTNERVMLACALRRMSLSFLCVDIILAMAADTSWSVQALGTEEWNLQDRICSNYQSAKRLIESKLRE